MNLIQLNLLTATLILACLFFRKLLGDRLTGKQLFAFWCVIASTYFLSRPFKWLIALANRTNVSLPNSIYAPLITTAKEAEVFVQNTLGNASVIPEDNSFLFNWIASLRYGWLTFFTASITVFLLLYFFGGHHIAVKRFKHLRPANQPLIDAWKAHHPLFRRYDIVYSDRIASPFTYGIIRPVIVLPKRMLTYEETAFFLILDHEYFHIRHFDALISSFFLLICCVDWFNPFVWWMFKQVKQALEMICDENVLAHQASDLRQEYALLLIQEIEEKRPTFTSSLSFAKNAAKSRITNIMLVNRKKGPRSFLTFLAISIVLCFLTISYAINEDAFVILQNTVAYAEADETSFSTKASLVTTNEVDQLAQDEWWTYEEYKEFFEKEKSDLIHLRNQKVEGFSAKEVEETLQLYEEILLDIQNGAKYSKAVAGDERSTIVLN